MNILVLGTTEKRHIILSMLYVLSNKGRTALVTDNKVYMMLSKDIEYEFYTEDTLICIAEYLEDYFPDGEYGDSLDGIDYIIWDSVETTIENPDVIVITDKGELYDKILDTDGVKMVPTFIYKEYDGLNKSLYHKLDFRFHNSIIKSFELIAKINKLISIPGDINRSVSIVLAEALGEKSDSILKLARKQRTDLKDLMKGSKQK